MLSPPMLEHGHPQAVEAPREERHGQQVECAHGVCDGVSVHFRPTPGSVHALGLLPEAQEHKHPTTTTATGKNMTRPVRFLSPTPRGRHA